MVRYLYNLRVCISGMSTRTILHDMQFPAKKSVPLQSSVSDVACFVCGRDVTEANSITAKTLPSGIVLLCDVHFALQ